MNTLLVWLHYKTSLCNYFSYVSSEFCLDSLSWLMIFNKCLCTVHTLVATAHEGKMYIRIYVYICIKLFASLCFYGCISFQSQSELYRNNLITHICFCFHFIKVLSNSYNLFDQLGCNHCLLYSFNAIRHFSVLGVIVSSYLLCKSMGVWWTHEQRKLEMWSLNWPKSFYSKVCIDFNSLHHTRQNNACPFNCMKLTGWHCLRCSGKAVECWEMHGTVRKFEIDGELEQYSSPLFFFLQNSQEPHSHVYSLPLRPKIHID